jgi:hypothetical protein
VVATGLTLVEPLADEELNPPGEIEIVVAPLAAQLSLLASTELMLVGFAVKDAIEGTEPVPGSESGALVMPAQFVRPTQASRMRTSAQTRDPEELHPSVPRLLLQRELAESKRNRVVVTAHGSLQAPV